MTRSVRPLVLTALALLGSLLVVVGAWMAWPVGPLYTGPRPGIYMGSVPRGFQRPDLLVAAIAIGGGLAVWRYRRCRLAGRLALASGVSTFLLAVGHTFLTTAGPFLLGGGYYVTLGGASLLVISGALRLRFPRPRSVGDPFRLSER